MKTVIIYSSKLNGRTSVLIEQGRIETTEAEVDIKFISEHNHLIAIYHFDGLLTIG